MIITIAYAAVAIVSFSILVICVQKRQMDKRNASEWGDEEVWCPSDTVAVVSAFFQRVTFFMGSLFRDLLTLYRLIPDWYPYWVAATELYETAFPMGPGYFFWSGVLSGHRLTWLDAVVCMIVTQGIVFTLDTYVIEFPDAPNPDIPHRQVLVLHGLMVSLGIIFITSLAKETIEYNKKHKKNKKSSGKPTRRSTRIRKKKKQEDEVTSDEEDENDQ